MPVTQRTTTDPAAALREAMTALDLAPHQLQLFDPDYPRFDAQRPLLVLAPQFDAARPLLILRYPATTELRAVIDGEAIGSTVESLPANATAWLLPALPAEYDLRGIEGLRGIVERLFGPDGCPWDQAQTPETLGTYFIEESYELVDAIERGTSDDIREELGDILAHVFMQTSVAQLRGDFTVEDVVDHIARKLVRRHPHVFGDVESDDPEEIERLWEQIKAEERAARDEVAQTAGTEDTRAGGASGTPAQKPRAGGASGTPAQKSRPEGALDSVPRAAPALVRSDQLIGRAERAGLGPSPTPARDELTAAIAALEVAPPADAIGALLWATVRLARTLEVDPEQALRAAANAFTTRFRTAEDQAHEAGTSLADLPWATRHGPWGPSAPKAQ
jgi:uncharacterized protein YabN with tetrapyrrole methylase and pyrophosphatase domain